MAFVWHAFSMGLAGLTVFFVQEEAYVVAGLVGIQAFMWAVTAAILYAREP